MPYYVDSFKLIISIYESVCSFQDSVVKIEIMVNLKSIFCYSDYRFKSCQLIAGFKNQY